MLLADALERRAGCRVKTEVVTDGWPKDASVLDDADCDRHATPTAAAKHPFNEHLDEVAS